MPSRMIGWVAGLFGDSQLKARVHFHAGPHSMPAACFDTRCDVPQLDVTPRR